MVVSGIAWLLVVLHGSKWYYMVAVIVHGIEWYCMVASGSAWY